MAPDVDPPRPAAAPPGATPAGGEVLDRVEEALEAVATALVRLDDGTYGRCATCGAEVGDERLAADPTRTACAAHL